MAEEKTEYPQYRRLELNENTTTKVNVTVESGRDLAAKDFGRSSDPYVMLHVTDRVCIKTLVIHLLRV